MRLMIAILAAVGCASCGGGSSSGSAMDASASSPPSTAAATTVSTDQPTSTPSTTTSSTSPSSSGAASSAPATSSAPTPAPASLPFYKIVEIPRLATTGSVTVTGVNDQGVAVGQIETTAAPRAWIYQHSSGALNELSLDPAESGAYANGISNSGVIAGAEVPNGPPVPGFWTVTGGAMPLSGTYSSYTQAIAANDNGTIIGNYGQSGSVSSLPVVWTAPGYAETTLAGLQCDQCTRSDVVASAVNDSELIAGSSNYSIYDNGAYVSSGMHATEWQDGNITDLGGLQGAEYSAAYAVNASGEVVGGSRTDPSSGAPTHAFLYHQGAMTDLGTLDGDTTSSANAINDGGQIVGASQNDTASRASSTRTARCRTSTR